MFTNVIINFFLTSESQKKDRAFKFYLKFKFAKLPGNVSELLDQCARAGPPN